MGRHKCMTKLDTTYGLEYECRSLCSHPRCTACKGKDVVDMMHKVYLEGVCQGHQKPYGGSSVADLSSCNRYVANRLLPVSRDSLDGQRPRDTAGREKKRAYFPHSFDAVLRTAAGGSVEE